MARSEELPDTLSTDAIVALMMTGAFRQLTQHEQMGWAGVEGTPFIAEYNGYTIVLDVQARERVSIFGNVAAFVDGQERLWTFHINLTEFQRC